jgi:SAM-dependent methyltransferase
MDNYEFCANWARQHATGPATRILDYGCGAGQIVKTLRQEGLAAYGCDTFYEGGDYSPSVDKDLFGGIVRRMDGAEIPFEDAHFDLVINNQVMEHVPNLDEALREIARVLKPGGLCLSLFPDKGVWREGHCGVPFLHWFPKNTRPRIYYAAALRSLGLGYHTEGKKVLRWSQDFCDWLDNWTYYRELDEIRSTYAKRFGRIEHIEDTWLQTRLEKRGRVAASTPAVFQRWLVRKLCGLVFVARKHA